MRSLQVLCHASFSCIFALPFVMISYAWYGQHFTSMLLLLCNRHDGEALACGNEAGELIVLSPSSSSPLTRFTNDTVKQDAWNITFKRSIGPKAHSPTSTNATMTGRPLYKKVNSARSTSYNNRHSKRSPRNSSSLLVSKYSELTCLAYSPNGKLLFVSKWIFYLC